MLLNEMELDIDQITENLNAFEKFLDTLPEKAPGLACGCCLRRFCFSWDPS